MENLILSKKEIAESFSTGKFEATFPYLSENVSWRIVGKKELKGKSEVVSICKETSLSQALAHTVFTAEQIIKDKNKVVIKGSGEFIKHGKRVNLIASCDIYEFNSKNQVETISSYCIAKRK